MALVIVFAVVAMLLAGAAYAAIKLREDIAAGRHGLGCLGTAGSARSARRNLHHLGNSRRPLSGPGRAFRSRRASVTFAVRETRMDAPKGRYRVEEKDGRLTVIDTLTGAPISSGAPPPGSGAAPPRRDGAVSRPAGLIERYGRLLLGLVVTRWDGEGRAIVAWQWEQNGRTRRWDAALGNAEQKRLGRALAAVSAFPLFVLSTIVAGFSFAWLLLPVTVPLTFWGVWSVMRLTRESGTSGLSGSAPGRRSEAEPQATSRS